MSLHVFISHSSEDREVAQQVCDMIEERGLKCWIAPRNIVPGREYASEIIDAINGCGALVLVLTENANSSKFVAKEVERAVDRGKPVIPLRVREVMPGKSLELFISSSHWIDAFTSPMDAKMDQLESALRPLCEMPPAPPRPAAPKPAAKPAARPATGAAGKPPLKAIGIGVAALLVLGVGASLLLGGDDEAPPRTGSAPAQVAAAPADTSPAGDVPPAGTARSAPTSAPSAITAPEAAPLPPVQAPLPAAESQLVAAVGKASGYERVNVIKSLTAQMPASLSEAAVVALVAGLEDRERRNAMDILANYMLAPLSVDGLEALSRPMQGHWRSWLFQRLGAQDVLPAGTGAADAARLMRGLDGDARLDAIRALAPVLAPVQGVEALNAVANPLTGYARTNAFTALAKQFRLGEDLRGVDIGPALRETDSRERQRMIEVFLPHLAGDQSAADLAALLGPMDQWSRANLVGLLRNHDKVAGDIALADALELMKGESGDHRVALVTHLAPQLAEPLAPADMARLAGPLTGYPRINAVKAMVGSGKVAPLSASAVTMLAEGLSDREQRQLIEALGPVMQGAG